MWILIIVVTVGSLTSTTYITKYNTFDECNKERERITVEMDKSYPVEEHNQYLLKCVPINYRRGVRI